MELSVAARPWALAPGNPMTRVLAVVLACEVLVFGLALPGMILVDHRGVGLSVAVCAAAAVLALAAAALASRGRGWALGWLTQVVGVALGALTWGMWIMGGLFLLLWTLAFVLGRRLDGDRPDAAAR